MRHDGFWFCFFGAASLVALVASYEAVSAPPDTVGGLILLGIFVGLALIAAHFLLRLLEDPRHNRHNGHNGHNGH